MFLTNIFFLYMYEFPMAFGGIRRLFHPPFHLIIEIPIFPYLPPPKFGIFNFFYKKMFDNFIIELFLHTIHKQARVRFLRRRFLRTARAFAFRISHRGPRVKPVGRTFSSGDKVFKRNALRHDLDNAAARRDTS